jgi:hypothetical protein
MATKAAAKNLSSLLLIRALHQQGEVNDWFYAVGCKAAEKSENDSYDTQIGITVNVEGQGRKKRSLAEGDLVELLVKTVPDYFSLLASSLNNSALLTTDSSLLRIDTSTTLLLTDFIPPASPPVPLMKAPPLRPLLSHGPPTTPLISHPLTKVPSPKSVKTQITEDPNHTDVPVNTKAKNGHNSESGRKTGDMEEDITIYQYTLIACSLDAAIQRVVLQCKGCSEYLKGLNRMGFALLTPLATEILEISLEMCLRESEDLIIKVVFLGSRVVSQKDLYQMQRFHTAILCWTCEAEEVIAGGLAGILGGGPGSNGSKSMLDNNDQSKGVCVGHEEWAESSRGAWYCLYPLPDEMSVIPLHAPQQSNDVNVRFIPNPLDLIDNIEAVTFVSETFKDPLAWSDHLLQSADEAQTLAHNLRMQEALNMTRLDGSEENVNPSIECGEVNKTHDKCDQATVKNMRGMIISKGRGGLLLSATHEEYLENRDKQVRLDDVMKYAKLSEVPLYTGYVMPGGELWTRRKNSAAKQGGGSWGLRI